MRRLLSITFLSALLGVLLLAFAVPGMATEGEAPAEPSAETTEETSHADGEATDTDHAEPAEADDEGQWTGLLGALVAAVLTGTLVFASSGTEGLGDDGHH